MVLRLFAAALTALVVAIATAVPVEQHTFHSIIDHFNFRPTTVPTFPLRYFVNDRHYVSGSSPCFFYAGNEADIMLFVNNSGFVFEAAREFGALVVFAEHRYYGLSNPFGDEFALGVPYNVSFLTVEQALADFNALNVHIRDKWSMSPDAAFIAFGGSYGANLAMWLRLRNPNLWAGAVASSATPLKHILRETNSFARIVAEAYGNVSSACPDLVRAGWDDLYGGAETAAGRASVARQLNLCRPLPDGGAADDVNGWISAALETMVQYGYPYPTAFYEPVPAYPFREACARMVRAGTGLGALRSAAEVYYNHTGQAGPCFGFDASVVAGADRHWRRTGQLHRIAEQQVRVRWRRSRVPVVEEGRGEIGLEETATDRAWGYQCCTEVYQPMPTDGRTDLERPHVPNRTAYFEGCAERWGVQPRPDWEETTFMGADIGAGSNLFLTSGQLDPWRAAGIQAVPRGAAPGSIIVRIIEGGAHHLDLRAANDLDPPSVQRVRMEEKEAVRRWIAQWKEVHPTGENDTVVKSATN